MLKRLLSVLLVFCLLSISIFTGQSASEAQEDYGDIGPISKNDRILILAPHPDDEAIACAGIIQRALKAGAKVRVAYLTNGDHNQFAFIVYEKRLTIRQKEFIHLGEVRRKEAIKAMELLGLRENDLVFLGYPDFGTFRIFSQYWQTDKPFRDILTRISSVPYKENLSFGAPYVGESILKDLKKVISDYNPNKIFVSHPSDVNVDHKSLYLFLQVALADLKWRFLPPRIYPYLVHCVGWPLPRHYHPKLELTPPRKFLDGNIRWLEFPLDPEELEKKHRAILCYKSQTESSAFYLLAFARKNELFGESLSIDLKSKPGLKGNALFSEPLGIFMQSKSGFGWDVLNAFMLQNGQVSYGVKDDLLLVRTEKRKKKSREPAFDLYLFGYNRQKAFASMPKIRIIVKKGKFRCFDGRKSVLLEGVSLEAGKDASTLSVPLRDLGDPEFILASLKTYEEGDSSFDSAGFCRLQIR